MAANRQIKLESDPLQDDYVGVVLVNNMVDDNAYFQYEDVPEATYENESLIEYVEEEEVQNDVYVVNEIVEDQGDRVKTHTLQIKRLTIDGQYQDIYRCLECAIDFVTVEDFTKFHKKIQRERHSSKTTADSIDNESVQSENMNNVEIDQVQQENDWVFIKEEQIVKQENDTETFGAGCEQYVELSENVNKNQEDDYEIGELIPVVQETAEDEDDGEKYFCCDCQLIFSDLESAELHVCNALNTETVEAVDAGICTRKIQDYSTNIQSKATEVQYHCLQCEKKFNSEQGLQIHSRSHKPKEMRAKSSNASEVKEIKSTTCPICNTTFASYKNLKLHMKIHDAQQVRTIEQALPAGAKTQYNDMNKFFCEICNKSFEQNLLGIHKNMHQQAAEYKCGICNRNFENKTSYDMHMQMHADKPTKSRKPPAKPADNTVDDKRNGRFPCQYCGRTFQRPFEKVRHERVHTGEKPHACEVCGKTFRVSYSLTLHLRTHTDIRPYVCATCNKRFKSQSVYAHHLRTHEAERAYKCETCSKSFRNSVQLSAHRNVHSKPYNCPVCNRPFASLYSVKIHMKTHNKPNRTSDVTKYKCYICGAEYARIPALRLHMKDLHLIDFDTNQSLELDDEVISGEEQNSQPLQGIEDIDDEQEVDHEAAVLIAAAAEADCAAYIEAATAQSSDAASPGTSGIGLHEQVNPDYELIVDNYQTEEIVTDWMSK
ncbi:zinc finger protein 271 [Rhagoletis pomonella]|uniref:zinc finger protein 271 n=1 Tax=Rhagoletis pomonella TaxID=28610 RepID=UPI00177AE59D|nr:zinc finger protein 271 [Rhagoletis pomonella]